MVPSFHNFCLLIDHDQVLTRAMIWWKDHAASREISFVVAATFIESAKVLWEHEFAPTSYITRILFGQGCLKDEAQRSFRLIADWRRRCYNTFQDGLRWLIVSNLIHKKLLTRSRCPSKGCSLVLSISLFLSELILWLDWFNSKGVIEIAAHCRSEVTHSFHNFGWRVPSIAGAWIQTG